MDTLEKQIAWYSDDIKWAISRGYETVNLQIPSSMKALWDTSEEFLENLFGDVVGVRIEVKKHIVVGIQVLAVRWDTN